MKLLVSYSWLLLALMFSAMSYSAGKKPYSDELFDQLAKTDDVVVVDVYADWCPTCGKQKKILSSFLKDNPDKPVHILVVDFDKDKSAVKKFKAPRQSTLLIFKSGQKHHHSVAETRSKVITAEINKALEYKPRKS